MSGPKGLINLSDPPTEVKGFRDGEECIVVLDDGPWLCTFHKGHGTEFDRIERKRNLFDDPSSKSG